MGTTSLALRSHQMLMRAMERVAGERRAFVREACADDAELLARVLKLLDAADRATSFLDTPALGSGTSPAQPRIDLPTPDAVGSYLVTGVLGSGGMATVYEAIQEDPERRVALKVLHRTVEDNAAYQRFRFEAEALARLKHPHIAQIYEAGAAPLGGDSPSPFFAMELVEDALPITRYVHERGLSMRERLKLFVSVCEAVHHGHQHGVIHRDIKPANVLVGADGVPKVIDFGIAMASGGEGQALTTGIDRGQLIGTLNAMSPEQCEAGEDGGDIDTRADVYALGVLLYEMVTARPPHDLSAMSVPQAIRTIVEADAPAPSTHNGAVRGDLDAIIGKAMRRDRRERYPSAAALASDLCRHLEHKPIEARSITLPGVMLRFARRSPALAGTIAAAVLVLVAGVVVSSSLAIEANAARQDAEARERSLERVVQYQESLLATIDITAIGDDMRAGLVEAVGVKGGQAPAQLAEAIGGINFTSLASHAIESAFLRPSHAAINAQFTDDSELRARMLHRLGMTMYKHGLPASTEPVLREALAIRREVLGDDHEDTLRSLNALGLALNVMGRYAEAREVMLEGYQRSVRVLGRDDESTMRLGVSLGLVHRALGELDEAEAVWRATYEDQKRVLGEEHDETLRTLNNLAVLHATRGELAKAAEQFAALLELRRRQFGSDSPETIPLALNLGIILRNKGDFQRSGELLGEALAIASRNLGDENSTTLRVLYSQAESARLAGDVDQAYGLIERVVDARTGTLGKGHPDTLLAQRLQAELVLDRGDAQAGLDGIEQVIAGLATALSAGHPLTHETRLIRAQMLLRAGDAQASLAECEATLAETRAGPRPNQGLLGRLLTGQGRALMALDRMDEAGPPLAEGAELLSAAQGAEHVYTRQAQAALAEYRARTASPGTP